MGMDKDKRLSASAKLRLHAEERLNLNPPDEHPLRAEDTPSRLLHELQVHQIELEMQNNELREARAEVEASLEKYTDLYDFAPVGYFTLDRNGTISAANLSGAYLLGIERSKLPGLRFGLLVANEFRLVFADFLDKVFANQGKESCEMALTKEGNHPRFVQIEALAEASGKVCRFAVIDITKRRLAEIELADKKRELEEINKSLESRIAESVEELRKKDQMLILQDRLSVMGEMVYNIAHQWNQPLNTLSMVVQQVSFYYETGTLTSELLKENTQQAMMQIMYMSRTIHDFIDLFKVDKEAVKFSVNSVITRTLFLVEKTFNEQMIRIAFQPEGDSMATGFPNEYSQVLLNILLNARDALIENKVENALVSIHSFVEGDKSVVTITDNAGGIAEEIIDKLFDAYFSTKGDKGTGIGLYMSKTIIEKSMGGRLTVRNTVGGAEFRISLSGVPS